MTNAPNNQQTTSERAGGEQKNRGCTRGLATVRKGTLRLYSRYDPYNSGNDHTGFFQICLRGLTYRPREARSNSSTSLPENSTDTFSRDSIDGTLGSASSKNDRYSR